MTKTALVTGAAHRLGKSFALTLARLEYDVYIHYRSAEEEARQTQAEIEALNRRAILVSADLAQPSQIVALLSTFQTLDVLVNSAAFMPKGDVKTLTLDDWDATLDLNLRAPFLLARECAKKMNSGGLIVNVTDVGAQKAWSRYPSYTVSKAALESLTKILARAFAPKIRVNAIAPGLVLQSDIVPHRPRRHPHLKPTNLPAACGLEVITHRFDVPTIDELGMRLDHVPTGPDELE